MSREDNKHGETSSHSEKENEDTKTLKYIPYINRWMTCYPGSQSLQEDRESPPSLFTWW